MIFQFGFEKMIVLKRGRKMRIKEELRIKGVISLALDDEAKDGERLREFVVTRTVGRQAVCRNAADPRAPPRPADRPSKHEHTTLPRAHVVVKGRQRLADSIWKNQRALHSVACICISCIPIGHFAFVPAY